MRDIVLIIDTSFSVSKNYIDIINFLIQSEKEKHQESRITLVTFNTKITYIYLNTPLNEIHRPIEIVPDGMTALYDCVNSILNNLLRFFTRTQQSNPVLFLLTDGDDNSSIITNHQHLKLQLNRIRTIGWKVVFLGTTLASLDIGRDSGCNVCVHYNSNSEKSINKVKGLIREVLDSIDSIPNNVQQDVDLLDLISTMENLNV